jgi:hypothetical protein
MFKKMIILLGVAFFIMLFLDSCKIAKSIKVTKSEPSEEPFACKGGLKSDVIGFSDNIVESYKSKLSPTPFCLSGSNVLEVIEYIKDMKQGQETALYYAFDKGLDRIKYVKSKDWLSGETKVFVITFTDGLDNISNQLGKIKGKSAEIWQEKYAKILHKKMDGTYVAVNGNFQSYVTVFFSNDLKQSNWKQEDITGILNPFSGTLKTGKTEVIISEKIEALSEGFREKFTNQNFKFSVPKGNVGQRIKMTLVLDNGTTADIEGDFSGSGEKYYLKTISTTNGIKFEGSNKQLVSSKSNSDAVKAEFELKNLQKADGNTLNLKQGKTEKENAQYQKQYIFQRNDWRLNSEYVPVSTSVKDAYILLVMDCSKSMGECEFIRAKIAMLQMIGVIVTEKEQKPIYRQALKMMEDFEKSYKDIECLQGDSLNEWTNLKQDLQNKLDDLQNI